MSLTLEQLPKLQEQINQTLKELLALEDEMLPEIQKKIKQISDLLTVGFNETTLKEQAIAALNQALNGSQIATIRNNAKTYQDTIAESIKKLQDTIISVEKEATRYQGITKKYKGLHVGIITGGLCFVLGAAIMWGTQYKRIDNYQSTISWLDRPNSKQTFCSSNATASGVFQYYRDGKDKSAN
jgi:DNA-binding XRE family transcriptional regulator